MEDPDSLRFPTPEEMAETDPMPVDPVEDPSLDTGNWENIPEPKDLSTEQIERLLAGLEFDPFMDTEDLKEVLLRRQYENDGFSRLQIYLMPLAVLFLLVFAFFGWKLYKSLRERELKREEKKKLKQKKKK